MSNNAPRMLDGSKYNVWTVVDLANSYCELSASFTSNLPTTVEELTEQRFLGVASVTNRILAVELYLKALLIGQGGLFPASHDLVVLFDALPEFIRRDIEHMFNERIQATSEVLPWELQYYFGIGPMPDSETREKVEQRTPRPENSLASLLVRNRKGFVSSRYLFEYAKRDEVSVFNYEYRRLAILCSILCEGVERSMQGQNPGYVRRFHFEIEQPNNVIPDYGNRNAYRSMSLNVSRFNINAE